MFLCLVASVRIDAAAFFRVEVMLFWIVIDVRIQFRYSTSRRSGSILEERSVIYFLTTRKHDYTIRICLNTDGTALADTVAPTCYGYVFLKNEFPPGTYIFSDLERLSLRDCQRAETIWDSLARDGRCRLVNHPTRTMKRFELLRALYARGVNQFNVYRLTDGTVPERFPVFIRGENDHKGARTGLLRTPQELAKAISRIDRTWKGRAGKMITEFCDVSDAQGIYRKYSAFRVGDRIQPRHLFFRHEWMVKGWKLLDDHLLEEERAFVAENPHEDQLREIFELAGIQFGRIDYGIVEGRIQVWEINTNPMILANYGDGGPARRQLQLAFRDAFVDAMHALDSPTGASDLPVRLPERAVPLWGAPRIPFEILQRRIAGGIRRRAA